MGSLNYIKERKSTPVLITVLFLLSFIGLLDALYLSSAEYQGIVVTCGSGGCAEVTSSEYSKILGVPVAYLGFGHYSVMLVLAFLVFALKKRSLLQLIFPLSVVGLAASSWFVFAQLVLLEAICYYCMLSAASSLLLFIVSSVLFLRNKAHLKLLVTNEDEVGSDNA